MEHDLTDRIVVVGAGVIGASIAYHLAAVGRAVTVLDQGLVGGGVTSDSFGWVGLAKSTAAAYSDPLRARAAEHFARLRHTLGPRLTLVSDGAVSWEQSTAETRAFVAEHQAVGHDVKLITRDEVLAREPALRAAPEVAALAEGDTAVDPRSFARALLGAAEALGARVLTGASVTGLVDDGNRVTGVLTPGGQILARTVVLAAGTATPALARLAGEHVDVESSPSCLLTFSSPGRLLRGILSTPDFEVRQQDAQTLVAAEDVPPGFTGDARELAAATLAAIHEQLAGGSEVKLLDARIGHRPVPRQVSPLVEFAARVDGLFLAVAHPGVILSAAIGAHVTGELE
ncbi:FAD-binding oxidoreductase [Leucobacter sp. BZR 635]